MTIIHFVHLLFTDGLENPKMNGGLPSSRTLSGDGFQNPNACSNYWSDYVRSPVALPYDGLLKLSKGARLCTFMIARRSDRKTMASFVERSAIQRANLDSWKETWLAASSLPRLGSRRSERNEG
jgi:hypothetical protein